MSTPQQQRVTKLLSALFDYDQKHISTFSGAVRRANELRYPASLDREMNLSNIRFILDKREPLLAAIPQASEEMLSYMEKDLLSTLQYIGYTNTNQSDNPLEYLDPDGREMSEEDLQAVRDDIMKNGTRMGEESPASNVDRIRASAESNMNEPYRNYQCDDWVAKVVSEAGITVDEFFAGNTRQKTVENHIAAADARGTARTDPEIGANIVFMNDSPRGFNAHAGLVIVNRDGSVDYYDSSSNNPDQMPIHEQYGSVELFQNAYAYRRFVYQSVR